MRLSAVFLGVVLAGCSLGITESPTLGPLDSLQIPNIGMLAQRLGDIFKDTKLVGAPEVSPLRKAPLTVVADWMLCLRGNAPGSSDIYAIFIQKGSVVDYRRAILIDACETERYEPLQVSAPLNVPVSKK
jgi:hypothetical protein